MKRLALLLLVAGCETTTMDEPDGGGGVTATFTSLYGDYFSECGRCHTPDGPGRVEDTEDTLDFSSKATAYSSITNGMASGLTGNFMDCNGVPFVGAMSDDSLIFAVLDQPTRAAFDLAGHPMCDEAAISDETLPGKVGRAPSTAFKQALADWIEAGTPNN